MVTALVIEDNPIIQEMVGYIFADLEHKLLQATTAAQARAYFAQWPDIVFCDYNLPGGNGHDLMLELRMYKELERIPIIGIGDFPDHEQYILKELHKKPFPSNMFEMMLEKYCSN